MGKQSARMLFNGKDHKDIYMNKNYHRQLHKEDNLLWEKLEEEEPYEPLDYFAMKVVDYMADYQTGEIASTSNPGYVEFNIDSEVTIDWGDGTVTTGVYEHTYPTCNGTEYIVKLSGESIVFHSCSHIGGIACSCVKEILTPLLSNMSTVTYDYDYLMYSGMFMYTPLLKKVPSFLFDNIRKYENVKANSLFECSGIENVPPNLFNGVNNWFIGGFYGSCDGIVTVPRNAFAGGTFVKINGSPFNNNKNLRFVYDYPSGHKPSFDNCPSIEELNFRIVGITSAENLFRGFSNLKRIGKDLFTDSPNITSFDSCFYMCGLVEIPEGLFNSQIGEKNFQRCFFNCTKITSNVPALWEKYDNGAVCFYGCVNAANYNDIPDNWK